MSMQEIARRTGLSSATVSRAFSQPDKVKPQTLQRIRKLCDELNYRPRVIPNRLNTVSLIVPSGDRFEASDGATVARMISLLNEQDLPTLVSTATALKQRPTIFQKAFIAIFRDHDPAAVELLRGYAKQGPFVAINDLDERFSPSAVYAGSDHQGAIEAALGHMFDRGHRRIGYVSRNIDRKGYRDRLSTYEKWMKQRGLFSEALVFNNQEPYLLEGLGRICRAGATAILVAESAPTFKVLHYLKVMGKSVPEDISMVTHEVAGMVEHLFPPLTCVVQPINELAAASVELILRMVHGDNKPMVKRTVLPYRFIDRESVRSVTAT